MALDALEMSGASEIGTGDELTMEKPVGRLGQLLRSRVRVLSCLL